MQRLARVRPAIKSFLNLNALYFLPQESIGNVACKTETKCFLADCLLRGGMLFPRGKAVSMSSRARPGGLGVFSTHWTLSVEPCFSRSNISKTMVGSEAGEAMVIWSVWENLQRTLSSHVPSLSHTRSEKCKTLGLREWNHGQMNRRLWELALYAEKATIQWKMKF